MITTGCSYKALTALVLTRRLKDFFAAFDPRDPEIPKGRIRSILLCFIGAKMPGAYQDLPWDTFGKGVLLA